MMLQLKALTVVLTLATLIFVFVKPICLRFTAPEDFARRRMVWYVLTITGFVSPSFWLYALIAVPMTAWAGRRDSNPLALYLLLLFVIPRVSIPIPVVGINQLFDMSNVRLLGLTVLLPAVFIRVHAANREHPSRFSGADAALLLFGALQLVLLYPYESVTNTMRRGFLFLLDVYLVFFAFSRLFRHKRDIVDAMGALFVAAAIFAPIAAFESLKGWLLYTDIALIWGSPNEHAWIHRGESLRAQAATGHAITLGYSFAMALASWMYLRSTQRSKALDVAAILLMCLGLVFTYARGPWVTAAFATLIFLALSARNVSSFFKTSLVLVIVGGLVAITPFGADLIDKLPFIGTQSQETVVYRQQLAETSWTLIQQNPVLGNPFVLLQMEDLRQAQGIIDIVNAYLQVALFYGLLGLALFLACYGIALYKAYKVLTRARSAKDFDTVALGAALVACIASTLVFMATAGQAYLQWALAGVLLSYASLKPIVSPAARDPAQISTSFPPRRAGAV